MASLGFAYPISPMKNHLLLAIGLCLGLINLPAQTSYPLRVYKGSSDPLAVQVANVTQDLELLRVELGQLKHEIAQLRQAYAQQHTRLDTQQQHQVALAQDIITQPQLDAILKQLRQEWRTEQAEQQLAITQTIGEQINQLAERFNHALQKLANSVTIRSKRGPSALPALDVIWVYLNNL